MSGYQRWLQTLISAWAVVLLATLLYGRERFAAFYSAQPHTLDSTLMALSHSYGRFLVFSGVAVVILKSLIALMVTRHQLGPRLLWLPVPVLFAGMVYSLLPPHYYPGGSSVAWFLGVSVLSPVYVLVCLAGVIMYRSKRKYHPPERPTCCRARRAERG